MGRRRIIAVAIVIAVGVAAVGGGVVIGRATRDSGDARVVEATPIPHSTVFVTDDQYEGRVLLASSVCTGDGAFTGFFRWTVAAGTESQEYEIRATPWDDWVRPYTYRRTATGQSKIGGFVPGREYTVTVYKPGSQAVWAVSKLTPPSCDDYQVACPPAADLMRIGPITGATTDTTAKIWLRTCYGSHLTIDYKPATSAWSAAQHVDAGAVDPSRDYTLVATIDGLAPDTRYDYRVTVDGVKPDQPDAHFSTKPRTGAPAKFRFLTASDMHQLNPVTRAGSGDGLAQMREADAQFAILLGDQLSIDDFGPFRPTSVEAYLRHYRENWSYAPFRLLLASVSTVMMWDDHDILNDWALKDIEPYPLAKEAFGIFVGGQNPPPVRPNGTYFTFDAGEAAFFVLDTRSFRDPRSVADGPGKTMLGANQKADLKQWLTTSKAKFKFVTSGVEFHDHQTVPLKQNDAWDGFKTERKELFDFIHDQHVAGVVLISGDSHWPGVFKHEYGIPEFQTSPIGVTPPRPPQGTIGAPDVIFADGGKNVFGRFDVDTTVSPARVDFTMVQSNGTELFKMTLTEADLAQ